jgi:hypothetical protein
MTILLLLDHDQRNSNFWNFLRLLDMTNHIKDTERQTTVFLLTVLQAVINEQVKVRRLYRDVGTYIYEAVEDMAEKQGFID